MLLQRSQPVCERRKLRLPETQQAGYPYPACCQTVISNLHLIFQSKGTP